MEGPGWVDVGIKRDGKRIDKVGRRVGRRADGFMNNRTDR